MKVSIITVCRNAEKHIEKAIQSVVSQTYRNIEFIIIDGASQDKTPTIIDTYRQQISHVISEPDQGIYNAMNKGLRYVTGDYIGFLNADDYYVDVYVIQDVVHFLTAHQDCDFVYGDLEVRHPPSGTTILHQPRPPAEILDDMICGCLPHQSSFARANLFFSRIGLFNERYRISSDYEWFLRLVYDEHVKLCYYPRTMASYYAGGVSSHIRRAVPESHAIQNQFPLYQQPYWVNRRLVKFQEHVVNLRECLAAKEANYDALKYDALKYDALKQDYEALLTNYRELSSNYKELEAELQRIRQK